MKPICQKYIMLSIATLILQDLVLELHLDNATIQSGSFACVNITRYVRTCSLNQPRVRAAKIAWSTGHNSLYHIHGTPRGLCQWSLQRYWNLGVDFSKNCVDINTWLPERRDSLLNYTMVVLLSVTWEKRQPAELYNGSTTQCHLREETACWTTQW